MSILDKFKLDNSLFSAIAENIDVLEPTSSTRTLTVGKTIDFKGTINGIEVPAQATLREASLTRLSILDQTSPYTGKQYYLVTGVMNPVRMDVTVTIDGEKIGLVDLLHKFVTESGQDLDRDTFEARLIRNGFNLNGGQRLFFQQFGANEAGFKHAIEAFKAAGAIDVTGRIDNPGRIVAAYQHQTGVPLTSFEVGTTDRSKSRTNQGFVDFVDATVDSFQRVYGLRMQAHLLGTKMEGLSQAKLAEAEKKRQALLQMAKQWVGNWAGSQQRILVTPSGAKEPQDIYDPVNAPCGRFTMVVNGQEVPCDLWSNSARANSASIETAPMMPVSDEKPF